MGKFRLELDRPRPGKQAGLEMYNGYWADGAPTTSPLNRAWDLSKPLTVTARYAVPLNKADRTKADRTLVRFEMPRVGFPEAGVIERTTALTQISADVMREAIEHERSVGEVIREPQASEPWPFSSAVVSSSSAELVGLSYRE